ncbi:MAG: hypothetical protein EOO68_24065 [Moraxellaceae bacterium]|nr:MAG: hypothetical protein EOO68_24065 [Moraxellaceae bacterium]
MDFKWRFTYSMVGCLLLSGLTTSVFASSGQAWAEHDRKLVQKCIAASGLVNTVVSSKPILFDDRVGYTAVTLRGHLKPLRSSQPKATATQEKLCLYERKTGTVHVEEIATASR